MKEREQHTEAEGRKRTNEKSIKISERSGRGREPSETKEYIAPSKEKNSEGESLSVPEAKERARRKWKAEGREKTGKARERDRGRKRASSVPRRQMRKGHDSRREEKEVAAR